MCVWAFASKGDREYFIKEFLRPKWPLEDSMGSEASKMQRRADCLEFERRHKEVMSQLKDATTTTGGGHLVTAVDFFRFGTAYYKVTDCVVTASLTSLADLTTRERAVIFRTLVLSLQMLHRKNIVHGDLKPANVLIQHVSGSGLHTAKLIDFDDSYLTGKPPPRDQIVGDSIYAAPEWFGYAMKDKLVTPAMLTTAADVFALALLFHYYLMGELPGFDRERFSAPGLAVRARQRLVPDPRLNSRFRALLERMTAPDPAGRPAIDQVFHELKQDTLLSVDERVDTGPSRGESSRVRIHMPRGSTGPSFGRPGTGPAETSPAETSPAETSPAETGRAATAPPASRVRINMPKKEETRER
jgi:serine/threonine protein kinase